MRHKKLVAAGLMFSMLFVGENSFTAEEVKASSAEISGSSSEYSDALPSKPIKITWSIFRTVPPDLKGHWAERLFQWAERNRIIEGYSDGTFRPDQMMTEAEFLKIFYRAFGYPRAVNPEESWEAAPYRLASMWNHPVSTGVKRFEPISRLKAAEIIASAQGVHYKGDDAIIYVLGNSLASGKTSPTVEGFAGNDPLTRAEAVQWIWKLLLKGITRIEERPKTPFAQSSLPSLPPPKTEELPDFEMASVTLDDFNLIDDEKQLTFGLGTPKASIEEHYGPSENQNVFHQDVYGLLAVHYDADGRMDAWKVNGDLQNQSPIRTNKEVSLWNDTFFEVMKKYGTAGFIRNDMGITLNYLYEKVDGSIVPRFSRDEIVDPDNALVISFLFDEKTLKVWYIYVATYQYAYRDSLIR